MRDTSHKKGFVSHTAAKTSRLPALQLVKPPGDLKDLNVDGKIILQYKGKGTAIPLQTLTGPEVSRRLRLPDFKTIGKVSTLRTGRLYSQEIFLVLISVRG
jgi:hypothetical protein